MDCHTTCTPSVIWSLKSYIDLIAFVFLSITPVKSPTCCNIILQIEDQSITKSLQGVRHVFIRFSVLEFHLVTNRCVFWGMARKKSHDPVCRWHRRKCHAVNRQPYLESAITLPWQFINPSKVHGWLRLCFLWHVLHLHTKLFALKQ